MDVRPSEAAFTFAGGQTTDAATSISLPMESMGGGALDIHVVPNESTPVLIGVDMLDRWGLVLDYFDNCVYGHILGRFLDCTRTVGGHLALTCAPGKE